MEWIMNLNDVKILDELFKISETSNWEYNLSEQELKTIQKGLKDFHEGRITSDDFVMKKYEKYL